MAFRLVAVDALVEIRLVLPMADSKTTKYFKILPNFLQNSNLTGPYC